MKQVDMQTEELTLFQRLKRTTADDLVNFGCLYGVVFPFIFFSILWCVINTWSWGLGMIRGLFV